MFFLFLGTRQRRRSLGGGTFHCPYCWAQRPYELTEVRTWFHVFWIPLVPLGTAQDVVQCGVCGGAWGPAVLTTPAERPGA